MRCSGICGDGLMVPVSSPRGRDTTPLATPVPDPDSFTSPSPPVVLPKRGKTLQPTQMPASTRASIVFPLLTSGGLFNQTREPNISKYKVIELFQLLSSNSLSLLRKLVVVVIFTFLLTIFLQYRSFVVYVVRTVILLLLFI